MPVLTTASYLVAAAEEMQCALGGRRRWAATAAALQSGYPPEFGMLGFALPTRCSMARLPGADGISVQAQRYWAGN